MRQAAVMTGWIATVVLLLENHANPKAYADAIAKAADTITVEGEKVTQGGMTGVVVEAVK